MKKPKKQKAPDFIKTAQAKLAEHFNAIVLEKIMHALEKKGFVFNSKEEMHTFFKNNIKRHVFEDTTTYLVNGVEFLVHKAPEFEQKGFEIKILTEIVEL